MIMYNPREIAGLAFLAISDVTIDITAYITALRKKA